MITLTGLDLVFLLSLVMAGGGWWGTLYFGFSERPIWMQIACFASMIAGCLTFVGAILYGVTT